MIYTCTLNPAIDYRLEVEALTLGKLNRATFNKFSAGGKGINVSLVLRALEVDSVALGFLGGFTGIYLHEYLSEVHQLTLDFIPIKEPTRINVKLASKENTEVNAKAPTVSRSEIEQLVHKIKTLKNDDFLVLAGSSVKSEENLYKVIAKTCYENNVPFIVDAENESLRQTLKYRPLLVKPNIHELESYFNQKIETEEALINSARILIDEGAQYVIVSLGKDGAYFVSDAVIYKADAVKGEALNPVGAGDSMVAGFTAAYKEKADLKACFSLAVACGTATAFSYDLAEKKAVLKILEEVKIKEVKHENRSIDR